MKPRRASSKSAAQAEAPPARNREQTEARILQAVGDVLARDGFTAIGINAVAREAGVDKVLIYRYFGGLPEMLAAWGGSGRFWPSVGELLGPDAKARKAFLAQSAAERWARFFEHFIDGLRARPLTVEILAAEVAARNELTALLEAEREAWGEEATRVLGGPEFARRPELLTLTLMLVAGVQYLLVRSRKIRIFGGIDLRTDAGWARLKTAVRAMAQRMLGGTP